MDIFLIRNKVRDLKERGKLEISYGRRREISFEKFKFEFLVIFLGKVVGRYFVMYFWSLYMKVGEWLLGLCFKD